MTAQQGTRWIWAAGSNLCALNPFLQSYPIDHLIIAAFLTFVTVFLELPLTVTTAGYLFITWPAFLVIEYTQNYTQVCGHPAVQLQSTVDNSARNGSCERTADSPLQLTCLACVQMPLSQGLNVLCVCAEGRS